MEEPGIRVIFDVYLHIDEHSAADEGGTMAYSPLCDRSRSTKTCKAKSLLSRRELAGAPDTRDAKGAIQL